MTSTPHNLRSIIAFALDLADSLGLDADSLSANDYGHVTVYAWDQGADTIDAIADRDGWPTEAYEGESWRGRQRTFEVDGRPVRIRVISHTAEKLAALAVTR